MARMLPAAFVLLFVLFRPVSAEEAETPQEAGDRPIVGWLEFVRLEPWGLKMRARIDTGAKTSSLSARDMNFFQRDDARWVRFTFDFKEDKGKKDRAIEIERPVVRTARIKRHGNLIQERPVVSMEVCIDNRVHQFDFTLIDRRGLNYPLLLGREALKHVGLVDPANSFLTKGACGHKKKKKAAEAAPATP